MRGVATGLCLLGATVAAANAGVLARHPLHHALVLLMHDNGAPPAGRGALLMRENSAPHFRGDAAPLFLGHSDLRYEPRPSGLDRIDPSAMRVWGGQIGGEGVKGGAVVSLTWPTD